jgi:glycerol uptake facilitator-like aquaporin
MLAVTGSSLASSQLGADSGLASVFGGVAISGALLALIFTFGTVSGGHFNPLITVLQWIAGERNARCMLWYVAAQISGALCGAWLTRLIFVTEPVLPKTLLDSSLSLLLSEMAATAGLMIVVFGCARSGRRDTGPIAVAAWLLASIMVMPSGSYANPAVSLGAIVSTGPVVLSSATAAAYVLVEVIGAVMAFGLISLTHPLHDSSRAEVVRRSGVNRNA